MKNSGINGSISIKALMESFPRWNLENHQGENSLERAGVVNRSSPRPEGWGLAPKYQTRWCSGELLPGTIVRVRIYLKVPSGIPQDRFIPLVSKYYPLSRKIQCLPHSSGNLPSTIVSMWRLTHPGQCCIAKPGLFGLVYSKIRTALPRRGKGNSNPCSQVGRKLK